MNRQELYRTIKDMIGRAVPEVLHVDLWNRNVEFIEQEDAWPRPAVFVEFGEITWTPLSAGVRRGAGTVRLHLVTDWADGGNDAAFRLSDKIRRAMDGLDGESFDHMTPASTQTNHDHEDILESIEVFGVRYTCV